MVAKRTGSGRGQGTFYHRWRKPAQYDWRVYAYVGMRNHYHVLVKVPFTTMPADEELLRRYRALYPKATKYQTARLEVIADQLKKNDPEAQTWRQRQCKLMGDVSTFMKLVKQRFSIWFNKSHRRYGALWAERFKSVLIEPRNHAIQTVAMYIDLNCVRAGLAADPKDYRFCGYAEAVGGSAVARSGVVAIVGSQLTWKDAQAHYREDLFGADPHCFISGLSTENRFQN
jgi:putative transposase